MTPAAAETGQSAQRGTGAAAFEAGTTLPGRIAAGLGLGLAAAWTAAGSTGLWAHPLRHALAWLCLAAALGALWPERRQPSGAWWTFTGVLALAALGLALLSPMVNVLAVALVLGVLARMHSGTAARAIIITALSVLILALYRLASGAIPAVWHLADGLGLALGTVAGRISGRPLWVGATFGGVDFLVLMTALAAGWLAATERPRVARALYAGGAVLGAHLLYLVALSFAPEVTAWIPTSSPLPPSEPPQTPLWFWGDALRTALPWNVPLLAAILHASVAALMFHWARWLPVAQPAAAAGRKGERWVRQLGAWKKVSEDLVSAEAAGPARSRPGSRIGWLLAVAALLALLAPAIGALSWSRTDLTGRTIVAYDRGRLDWQKPRHDSYGQASAGRYGMLPGLVESLGGRFVVSRDLAEQDLDQAAVLLLLQPNRPWADDQRERIAHYVAGGGTLVLAAGCPVPGEDAAGPCNELLDPTAMRVRHDWALPETINWRHAIESPLNPVTAGVDDTRDQLGIQDGASLWVRWPARPLVVGRWGWSEPGTEAIATRRYDGGEKLGDLVLAAEQPYGQGSVVVLGDALALSNTCCISSYPFIGRLCGFQTHAAADPQVWWRQLLGAAVMLLLVALLAWRPDPRAVGLASLALAASLAGSTAASAWISRVLPDGRPHTPNRVAYIDASHLEAHSGAGWQDRGIQGLALNLMRNGWLPLLMPEFSAERLERAGLLISIAPARQFLSAERQAVRRFVAEGGIFIATVGAEDTLGSRELLADFGFRVPRTPATLSDEEPEVAPVGAFLTTYAPGSPAQVMFHAGWEVACEGQTARVRVANRNGRPIVVTQTAGRGVVAVIADAQFALNVNLERADGQPVYGSHRNCLFWRWLLGELTDQPWIPPASEPDETGPADAKRDASSLPPGEKTRPAPAQGVPQPGRPSAQDPAAEGEAQVSQEAVV